MAKKTQMSCYHEIIHGEFINESDNTKCLGTIIESDNKLTWENQIIYISGKVARYIGITIKSRKRINRNSLMCLYYLFFYPYLIECNHAWGTTESWDKWLFIYESFEVCPVRQFLLLRKAFMNGCTVSSSQSRSFGYKFRHLFIIFQQF